MIKLSIKLDLSLGKKLFGFAGTSVAVFAYKFHSPKQSEEENSDIIPTDLQNCCTENKQVTYVKSTPSSKK